MKREAGGYEHAIDGLIAAADETAMVDRLSAKKLRVLAGT
jgi:hypothetical protein